MTTPTSFPGLVLALALDALFTAFFLAYVVPLLAFVQWLASIVSKMT